MSNLRIYQNDKRKPKISCFRQPFFVTTIVSSVFVSGTLSSVFCLQYFVISVLSSVCCPRCSHQYFVLIPLSFIVSLFYYSDHCECEMESLCDRNNGINLYVICVVTTSSAISNTPVKPTPKVYHSQTVTSIFSNHTYTMFAN